MPKDKWEPVYCDDGKTLQTHIRVTRAPNRGVCVRVTFCCKKHHNSAAKFFEWEMEQWGALAFANDVLEAAGQKMRS